MHSDSTERQDDLADGADTTSDPGRVSGRFLTNLFRVLEDRGLPASELLGDLPILSGTRHTLILMFYERKVANAG